MHEGQDEGSVPNPRRRRRARLLGRVLGLFSLTIALALFEFTQTATGRNAAISLLQRALEGAVDGRCGSARCLVAISSRGWC